MKNSITLFKLSLLTTLFTITFSSYTMQDQYGSQKSRYHHDGLKNYPTPDGLTVHPVCREIKKIEFDSPDKEYKNLAQKLDKNNLTVCYCAQQILAEKKLKAARAIDPHWKLDANPFKVSYITLECDKSLSPELCKEIKHVFERENEKNAQHFDTITHVRAKKSYTTGISLDDNQGIEYPHPVNIVHATLFLHNQEIGALPHEKAHLEQLHYYEQEALLKNPKTNINRFLKKQELEADILPVCCSQYWKKNNLIGFFKVIIKEEIPVEMEDFGISFSKPFLNSIINCLEYYNVQRRRCKAILTKFDTKTKKYMPEHPALASRVQWQIKLARLMAEQEKIKNTF